MPPSQKSQDKLVWMELIVVAPNRFVITANWPWMDDRGKIMHKKCHFEIIN